MSKASTDASQSMNLEDKVSTKANPIEEPTLEIVTDLSEKYKEPLALEVSSSTLESSPPPELQSSLITLEYTCLKSNDTLSTPITSNSTPNLKTQFMSILEE